MDRRKRLTHGDSIHGQTYCIWLRITPQSNNLVLFRGEIVLTVRRPLEYERIKVLNFNHMRILALVPGGISDQLLFFPALDDIKKAYPNAEIGVVAEPKAAAAYRVSKIVDTVVPFSFSAAKSPSDWANLLGVVRDREYEVVLSADDSWSTGLMLWLSGIPTRVTYKSTKAPYFYTATVSSAAGYQGDRYRYELSLLCKDVLEQQIQKAHLK